MEKIGVFCSASDTIDKIYFLKTNELGEWMGKQNKTLVYGGANLGLMECIARAVKQNGGTVTGVLPAKLEENGEASMLPDKIIQTNSLGDRKDTILRESDVLVALPGGIGTLDEVFHVMASASAGYHSKKVIFYNINGFFNGLARILETICEKHFARHKPEYYFDVANTFDELINRLTQEGKK